MRSSLILLLTLFLWAEGWFQPRPTQIGGDKTSVARMSMAHLLCPMKTNRTPLLVAVLCVAATVSWITYRQAMAARLQRINCVSNLKQIGLSFRMGKNDWVEPFPLGWKHYLASDAGFQKAQPETGSK